MPCHAAEADLVAPLLVLQFVKYGFVGLALCMSSAAVYAVLYQLVMPNKLHERPLYFQYGSSECYATNSCRYAGRRCLTQQPAPKPPVIPTIVSTVA